MATGHDVAVPAHVPVLFHEAIEALAVRPDGRYLDGTFGRGGHARAVLQGLGPEGRLLLMDKDPQAIAAVVPALGVDARVAVRQDSFAHMAHWDDARAGLDGVLLDLGVSSPQLDQPERGFSFQHDGPLDMRMNPDAGESAAAFLARADQDDIAEVLWQFGEERMSRRIARAIVERRAQEAIVSTRQLADLIAATIGRREPGKHPATRSFQALRIYINRELDDLSQGLEAALECLRPAGRLAVISFHSLEDRIVKRFMLGHARAPAANRRLPAVTNFTARLRLVGGAITASDAEVDANPRARSAVLRVAEKLA
jgi:16S rRNA (cytosine1402-N4)-methyltransferase